MSETTVSLFRKTFLFLLLHGPFHFVVEGFLLLGSNFLFLDSGAFLEDSVRFLSSIFRGFICCAVHSALLPFHFLASNISVLVTRFVTVLFFRDFFFFSHHG